MIEQIHILKTHPGCTIYELDLRSQKISVFNDFKSMGAGIIRYEPKEDHWYESAINEQSAFKKFNKRAMKIVTGKTN